MSITVRRSSHLSRHLAGLRQQRGLRPGQLAACLGASNISKVGSMIRAFELGEPLSVHWIKKLVAELQPDPTGLRQCLELDRAEAAEQLERDRIAWELWADEPIEPFLTIRYMPAVYGVREVPRAFCTPRESAEDREWARERAEVWAADELRRFRAMGYLTWSRRERTWYEQHGLNPRRLPERFEDRDYEAWVRVCRSQRKFLLGSLPRPVTIREGLG